MDNIFPQITTECAECTARHISFMEKMLATWYGCGGVQWTPGMIVPPELNARFDTFVPWAEVSRSLRRVARAFLPAPEWIPGILRDGAVETLLDFWQELPELQGLAAPMPGDELNFFCACADPPRFGTKTGRYPQQLEILRQLPKPAKMLDLGCGVGLGTLEIADALKPRETCGVTIEPLEVWMAERRSLPHDQRRSREYMNFRHLDNVTFRAADIVEYRGKMPADLIICNGLAGGRFLNAPAQIEKFLDCLEENAAPAAVLAAANSFHHGHRPGVERFLAAAAQRGWTVSGSWHNAILKKNTV
ncbi:MAG: class I SAM-dependent methyltransferase [Victivallales bacterium]|nr:class I SAM-dependent methyltransferase [Victivallales bacterium]